MVYSARASVSLLVLLVLLAGCHQETNEEARARMWKAASKACERYATKRYEARQLLAYDPEEWLRDQKLSFEEQEAKIWRKYSTENMDALFRLRDLDVRACLRGALWTDDSINELMQKDLAERLKDSPKGPKQAKPR